MLRLNWWIVFTLCLVLMTVSIPYAAVASWEESPMVGNLFKSTKVNGTFVLYDVTANTYIGHDKARAEARYIPASTFKIPNSLIGLSVGAVKSIDEVLPYRGNPHFFNQAWAKDMGLREAIAISNVPIYQELARRVGIERMRENVSRLDYGNKEIGTSVDTFWLKGPLMISAVEQTQFLAKLAQDTLPFPKAFQNNVREIVLLEQGKNWKLYGKTGWGENAPDKGVGWWVGWVEKDGNVYTFALNMDMQISDASKRIELGKASLKALGIL